MEFTNSADLPFPVQTVWDGLNNPEILRACIPGCESFEAPTPDHFDVVSVLKIGMIKARFEGAVELSDIDAPTSYRISGSGKGGVAGYASGQARVWLEEIKSGTRLNYEARADVGGKIAQLGSRLIDTVANKMADQFFQSFAKELQLREDGPQIKGTQAKDTPEAAVVQPTALASRGGAAAGPLAVPGGRNDWLLPYFIGLGCGVLIGAFAAMALG